MGEVLIVQATAASQFPNSFDGIQFGAIEGRKEIQSEVFSIPVALWLMKQGVMVLGIVGDDNHSPARPDTGPAKALHDPAAIAHRSAPPAKTRSRSWRDCWQTDKENSRDVSIT